MSIDSSPRRPVRRFSLTPTCGNEVIRFPSIDKTASNAMPFKCGPVAIPVRTSGSPSTITVKDAMRIPTTFRSVYLSSNRGNEIIESPVAEIAIRTSKAFPNEKQRLKGSQLKMPLRTVSSESEFDFKRNSTDSESLSDDAMSLQSGKKFDTSPNEYFEELLKSRGYPTDTRKATETGYYTEPTLLQTTSYHPRLIKMARDGKNSQLQSMMTSGIALNPCNAHGESLMHIVCRRGKPATLQLLLDCGSSVQTCDDYGRTLLHEACLRAPPCFEMIEQIANKDLQLFHLVDNRGFTPLSYVNKEYWNEWICFLDSKKDTWWPFIATGGSREREGKIPGNQSFLLDIPPKTRIIPDPENALDLKLAQMVLAGVISPKEAILLNDDFDSSSEEDDDDEDFADDFSENCPSLVDFTSRSESMVDYIDSDFSDDEYLDDQIILRF